MVKLFRRRVSMDISAILRVIEESNETNAYASGQHVHKEV
jgi:hypothetical protein